jgi:predicted nucleotidyltransferase
VRKTFGVAERLRNALAPLAGQLDWAFIYGSMAKGDAHSESDIDLMLIGEHLQYSDVMEHLLAVEELVRRTINPTLYSLAEWHSKLEQGNSFVTRVQQQEKINLIGGNPWEPKDGHA